MPASNVPRHSQILENLERLHFKLRIEAEMAQDPKLNARLDHLANEAEDTLAVMMTEFETNHVEGFTSAT